MNCQPVCVPAKNIVDVSYWAPSLSTNITRKAVGEGLDHQTAVHALAAPILHVRLGHVQHIATLVRPC
jgi:hypothetical protein